jgi:LemA protein
MTVGSLNASSMEAEASLGVRPQDTAMGVIFIAAIILFAALGGIYLLLRAGRTLRRASAQLDKDWSDIEVLVKQRNDHLPRLVQTCRAYMPADHPALKAVAETRSAYQKANSVGERAAADARIARSLQKLFSEAGQYDGLKNNHTFMQLHSRLVEIDETISERRDLFNEDVTRFNTRLAGFPGSLMKGKLKPRAIFGTHRS